MKQTIGSRLIIIFYDGDRILIDSHNRVNRFEISLMILSTEKYFYSLFTVAMHLVGLAVLSVAAAALADVHIESYAGAHPYIGCRFRSTDDSPILALRASDGKFLVPREAWNTFKMDDVRRLWLFVRLFPFADCQTVTDSF